MSQSEPVELLKSFGNGVYIILFLNQEAGPDIMDAVVESLPITIDERIYTSDNRAYLLAREGHPVSIYEARSTMDDWDDFRQIVLEKGSLEFIRRMEVLDMDRSFFLPKSEVQ